MLVCSVSMRPPRRAIAADVLEAGAAIDTLGTGQLVLATLVDDPANVLDTVDAFLGEIMLEAASASDAPDAGLVYAATINEVVTAISAEDGSISTAPPPTTTWNPSDKSFITLSNGDLTLTSASTNCFVRAVNGVSSGKYYYEVTGTNTTTGDWIGMALASAGLVGLPAGAVWLEWGGNVYRGSSALFNMSGWGNGSVICIAVDRTANLIWFRVGSGNWNGNATYNPATGVGGVDISSISGMLLPAYQTTSGSGRIYTANFGASTFAQSVPSGFNPGIPA